MLTSVYFRSVAFGIAQHCQFVCRQFRIRCLECCTLGSRACRRTLLSVRGSSNLRLIGRRQLAPFVDVARPRIGTPLTNGSGQDLPATKIYVAPQSPGQQELEKRLRVLVRSEDFEGEEVVELVDRVTRCGLPEFFGSFDLLFELLTSLPSFLHPIEQSTECQTRFVDILRTHRSPQLQGCSSRHFR